MKPHTVHPDAVFGRLALLPLCNAQGSDPNEIEKLKAKLVDQQKQIDSLVQALKDEQKLIQGLASLPRRKTAGCWLPPSPMLIALPAAPAATPKFAPPQKQNADAPASPLQLQLGNVTIMPVGFMDLTADLERQERRDRFGSNFGGVPYNNVATGNLSEFRFSPQNSRLGFRAEGD